MSTGTLTKDDINELKLKADVFGFVNFDPNTGTLSGASAGAVANSVRAKSTAASGKTFDGAGNSASAGFTLSTQQPARAKPFAVQGFFLNWSASTWAVTSAAIVSVPTHLNNGSGLTPTAFTFPNGNTVPVALSGAGNDIVWGVLASNVMPITAVDRTDTATYPQGLPLFQCRTYSADAQGYVAGADMTAYNAAQAYEQWGTKATSGDRVTGWPSEGLAETSSGVIQPAVLKFFYSMESFTIASAGDSLTRGQGSTANALGWPKRLANTLNDPTKLIVESCNVAWSGQKHAASSGIAKQVITYIKPNALTLCAWSPNDGSATQAVMDTCWAETLEIMELCRQAGIMFIGCTSPTVNSYSTADKARITAQNARLLALEASGTCLVFDFATVINDPSNPAQINPLYNSGDGLHYNDAGYAAMAAHAAAKLRPYL